MLGPQTRCGLAGGDLCWEDREAVSGGPGHRSPTCRAVLRGLLLRLSTCRGRGEGAQAVGQLPSKGQGLLGLKDKGGREQGKERVAGLNGPEEKKT